jgi:chromate transport protein ChrA
MMNDQQSHRRPVPAVMLAVLLLILQPISLALTMSGLIDELSARGPGLAVIMLLRLAAAGLGIAAGLAIVQRQPGAFTIAKASLAFSAIVDIIVWATPYSPNNRPPGDATIILIGSLLYYSGWLVYLVRLKADTT